MGGGLKSAATALLILCFMPKHKKVEQYLCKYIAILNKPENQLIGDFKVVYKI